MKTLPRVVPGRPCATTEVERIKSDDRILSRGIMVKWDKGERRIGSKEGRVQRKANCSSLI
jgi:hypothetical protein